MLALCASLYVIAAQFLLVPTQVTRVRKSAAPLAALGKGVSGAFEGVPGLYGSDAQLRTKASNSRTFLVVAPKGFEPVFSVRHALS
jgi:hypothetical protein